MLRYDIESLKQHAQEKLECGDAVDAYIAAQEAIRLEGSAERLVPSEAIANDPVLVAYLEKIATASPPAHPPKPLRILIISNMFTPQEMGGYGRQMAEFSRELHRRGHELKILTTDIPSLATASDPELLSLEHLVERSLATALDWSKLPAVAYDTHTLARNMKDNVLHIRNNINAFRPDVCLLGNVDSLGGATLTEPIRHEIPTLHFAGLKDMGYKKSNTPISPLFRIAPCSDWLGKLLTERGYCGYGYDTLYPGGLLEQFYMHYEPPYDKLRIAYASLLISSKGAETLIEALTLLKRDGIAFECELAGDCLEQGYKDKLQGVIRDAGIEDQVHFKGLLDTKELRALYARSNVLVFPSIADETFGKSAIEAMAARLLLISTSTGGQAEVYEENVSGIRFAPKDSQALAAALKSLPEDCDRWKTIATKGQERAFKFTTTKSVDKLDALMERAVEKISPQSSAQADTLIKSQADRDGICQKANDAIAKGDFAEAETLINEIQDSSAASMRVLANIHAHKGNYDDALYSILESIMAENNAAEGYGLLAQLYAKADRQDIADVYHQFATEIGGSRE